MGVFYTFLFTIPLKAQKQTHKFSRFATKSIEFEHLSIENGLSSNTINAILQDRRGFMWFGTGGGLNRYDGYTFTSYQHDPEDNTTISDNIIRALVEDIKNREL